MLLSVSRVGKLYGVDVVLEDVSFQIAAGEKVALVGRNGTGKTTLLRILTGQLEHDGGHIRLATGAKVGYLKQEAPVEAGSTVLQEAQRGREALLAMRERLAELEALLENNPTEDELEEYARLHEHFVDAQGYTAEADVRGVLQRMGFMPEEFDKSTDDLSGGEKTRLAIGRLLLEEPDLLILDEPTNHLDLQATEWLEGWIRRYPGAVLLVSHDRTFLEATAGRVLELSERTIRAYPGPFAHYLKVKAEMEARKAEVIRRQEEQIGKLDEFVRRFMNSQRTAQARGRLKQMNKLIENRVGATEREASMTAGFGKVARSGDRVAFAESLTVGYGDHALFSGLDWTVRWSERWGVIGENGAGKSSLIRVILGRQAALAGRAGLGSRVELGYFAQDLVDIDAELSPLDFIMWECDLQVGPARDLLARFLIRGDDVFRPIASLSGGEKNKLVLASLTQMNPNLLVLDEPTNHLDMDSREALASVLKEYRGTLILISHDRWLLGQVTEQILDVRKAGCVVYPGSYDEYRRGTPAAETIVERRKRPEPVPEPTMSARELSKEISRLEKLLLEIEDHVSTCEEDVRANEARLANPAGEDVWQLTLEHGRLREALEGALSAWEEQASRLESLRTQQGQAGKPES